MTKSERPDPTDTPLIGDEEFTTITVRGAREHNLRNVHLTIPRDKLVVITGLSGSGKSSLAFDTIYAEGQRRYVECMSSYARQFLGVMKKPDVDVIEGLSPAISIEQKSIGLSPRSTVGTVTEIYDYLRLLYARVGVQYCVTCNLPVRQQTIDQIEDTLLAYTDHVRVQVLAPVVKGRKGHYRELFDQFRRQGYTRVRVDGEMKELSEGMQLARYKVHTIELVVDRLNIDRTSPRRLRESLEAALNLGDGGMMVLREEEDGTWTDTFFSTSYSCPSCGRSYETPAPNMFSFNSPFGACTACEGIGFVTDFDLALIIPDRSKTIAEGAIAPLGKKRDTWLWKQVLSFCKSQGIDTMVRVAMLKPDDLEMILYGTEGSIDVQYSDQTVKHRYIGVLPSIRHQYEQTGTASVRKSIEKYFATQPCRTCKGARLKEAHLFVRVGEKNIYDTTIMDVVDAEEWFSHISERLSDRQNIIAFLILKEIRERLRFLRDVGLTYLSLNRSARTLSGGESQRIRLASQIGSQLVGVTYVLDEPSIGLHQHDNRKLIASLKHLRDLGNSVIVVEHDREMIEEADEVCLLYTSPSPRD